MTFEIKLFESQTLETRGRGEISLATYSEQFECTFEFWSREDYENHWYKCIRRVVIDRLDSCLITSLTDPRTANFLFWWPIYMTSEDSVAIRNEVLFLDQHHVHFDPDAPFSSLRPRAVTSEEGIKISEWHLPLASLDSWLNKHSL
jgi:hypothetical protein